MFGDVPSVPLPNNKSDYDEFITLHLNNLTNVVKLEMPSQNEMKDYFGGDYYLRALPCYHGKLRKHVLPWIPSLQVENGQTLERSKKVACAISPSGMGKTAFMSRCLTKIPGLLVTGSVWYETDTGETTDTSVALFHELLSSLGICKKYAGIRQGIQLIFISHLIHIINAIHNAKQDKSLLDPFEGSLCAYIGYIQSNGNTSHIGSTFNDLKQYFYSDLNSLRDITVHLIEKVCELTQPEFIICVDEANVFESKFGEYVSPNGNTRGFLSIIASEVSILMKMTRLFTNVIYAGTNFSIDISKVIVHSAIGKTESISSIQYLMDFDYFDLEQFISFLKKHITLPNSDENNIRTWMNRFPIRRRHASLVLEEMLQNCKEDKLEQGFAKAKRTMQEAIEDKILEYVELIETRSEAIQADYPAETFNDVLFRYIIHYEYPGLLGHQFKVKNKTIANNILSSGLTAPKTITDEESVFEAKDFLGYAVAKSILSLSDPRTNDQLSLRERCKLFITRNAKHREELENIIALTLLDLENTQISNSIFNTTLTGSIKNLKFNNLRIMLPTEFKEYCVTQGWIFDTEPMNGENLYWYYMINHCDRIDGIIMKPTTYCHADILLFIKGDTGKKGKNSLLMSFSAKCLAGKDMNADQGFKSTLPDLFYIDKYEDAPVDDTENYMKNHFHSFKVNENNTWWKDLRGDVLKKLSESVICLQTIIHIHPNKCLQRTQAYLKNCVWVDMENNGETFFGKTIHKELVPFMQNVQTLNEKSQQKSKETKK